MTKSIHTEISDAVLQFAPESGPVSFDITVYNDSAQFASFQVALVAAGVDPTIQTWYRFSPAVSSKIPPGDQTRFQAHVLAVPPVPGGFTGTMNLTVRVYSTELRDEDRKDLRLIITGEGLLAPKVTLPKKTFKAHPQEHLTIEADVYNPNRKSIEVVLALTGLMAQWFPEGIQKTVTLLPSEEKRLTFLCQLPQPTAVPSAVYPCLVEVVEPESTAPPQQALVEVLPWGFVEFQSVPLERWLPETSGRLLNALEASTQYTLTFENQSNLELSGTVSVVDEAAQERQERRQRRRPIALPFRPRPTESPSPESVSLEAAALALPPGLTLDQDAVTMAPGKTASLSLAVSQRLPWVGWARLKRFDVQARLIEAPLDLRNDTQTLELHIRPVVPLWLQLLGGVAGLFLLGLLWWWITERGHTNNVNSVQFNGAGTEVISVADDETIRRWRVAGGRLRPAGILERSSKAVRVVKYRPVNNTWMAAGLENGDIQMQSLVVAGGRNTLVAAQDDRVFDLAFDQNSQALWSAHGSGLIRKWTLSPDLASERVISVEPAFDFALRALALGGPTRSLLAVGGRYQQLAIVDLSTETLFNLTYPHSGSQTDYINSLGIAEEYPNLLAVGDSQGFISLWNLTACVAAGGQCEPIDEWSGHGSAAVRSVALSPDGCHLVSAGDDGRVLRWPLTGAGERRPDQLEGQVLRRSRQFVNSVDIRPRDRHLLIVSGGDDDNVRLNRVRLRPDDQCRTTPQ